MFYENAEGKRTISMAVSSATTFGLEGRQRELNIRALP